VPSSGATPDKDGVYGMIKVRGVFATENEANVRAEFLIRNNDSYHTIYHSIVGRPIPLSHNSKYVADTVEIDLNKKVTSTMKEDMKEKKEKDKKELEDIKKREANLLEDVKKAPEDVDPEDEAEAWENYLFDKRFPLFVEIFFIDLKKKKINLILSPFV
jgi:hypothetical protein